MTRADQAGLRVVPGVPGRRGHHEHVLQPDDLDEPAHAPGHRDQAQPPALRPDGLPGGEQRGQARAVDEGHAGKVEGQLGAIGPDHPGQPCQTGPDSISSSPPTATVIVGNTEQTRVSSRTSDPPCRVCEPSPRARAFRQAYVVRAGPRPGDPAGRCCSRRPEPRAADARRAGRGQDGAAGIRGWARLTTRPGDAYRRARPGMRMGRKLAWGRTAITGQACFTHGSLQPYHAPEAQPYHGDNGDTGQDHESSAKPPHAGLHPGALGLGVWDSAGTSA